MKDCFFKTHKIKYIDYRDTDLLRLFINQHGAILPRKRTKISAKFQRKIEIAIKRARYMGLLPYSQY